MEIAPEDEEFFAEGGESGGVGAEAVKGQVSEGGGKGMIERGGVDGQWDCGGGITFRRLSVRGIRRLGPPRAVSGGCVSSLG